GMLRRWRRAGALRRAGPWAGLVDRLAQEGMVVPTTDPPAEVVIRARRALPHLDADALDALRRFEETRRYAAVDPDRVEGERALSRL
ncbi:MAG TPA: hypothetical protein VMM13_11905, partial [Euzebya sp.]|nr:hypothetical protein [Euzebya sp.]